MLTDKDIEKMIEQQKAKGEDRVWAKLEASIEWKEKTPAQSKRKARKKWWRMGACAAALALLVVGVWVGGSLFSPTHSTDGSASSEGASTEEFVSSFEEEHRYCTTSDYTVVASEKTLKQISLEEPENMLFFDWYDSEGYNETSLYQLNENNEVVAIQERIVNGATGADVTLYVVRNNVELQTLEAFDEHCINKTTIQQIDIVLSFGKTSYTKLIYKNFTYYMQVEALASQEALFTLIEELLP